MAQQEQLCLCAEGILLYIPTTRLLLLAMYDPPGQVQLCFE